MANGMVRKPFNHDSVFRSFPVAGGDDRECTLPVPGT